MKEYVLSTGAEMDLDEIWEYIAQDKIDAADRWIGKLFDAFDALARTPGMGHKREDLTAYPILFWPVGAYLILYRIQSERLEIVAVTQGDNRNIMAAHIAKHIFKVPKVLLRIYDPLRRELYNTLGLEAFSPTVIFAQLLKNNLLDRGK